MVMSLEERIARARTLDTRVSPNVRRATVTEMQIRSSSDGILTVDGLASATSARAGSIESGGALVRDNGYDMGWYTERVIAGAFTETLSQNPDVSLFINHTGLAYARTTNGTLTLRENPDRGLEFTASVDERLDGAQDLALRIESGLTDQCSFAFRIKARGWDEDRENMDILGVDLHRGDVSVVSYGANPATPVGVRSLVAAFADLDDETLDDLRGNPDAEHVARIILGLDAHRAPEPTTEPEGERISLDLARARAYALSKRNQRR
jgi:HK97 family phage prohead protease